MRTQPPLQTFGLGDYVRMFCKRGIKLPWFYFLNAHLFDLQHQTDTHFWLRKEHYDTQPENFEHGILYMCSWTSAIQRSFQSTRALLKDFGERTFVDIGCGKGKVLLVWGLLLRRYKLSQKIYGIDYYEPLLDYARLNHQKIFGSSGNFILADAAQLDYGQVFGHKLLIYLYNPFDAALLHKVMLRMAEMDVVIIYNNPVHQHVLIDLGFTVIDEHKGFHPNLQTVILHKSPSAE